MTMADGSPGRLASSCSFRVADPKWSVIGGGPDELPSRFVVGSTDTILLWTVADVTKAREHHSGALWNPYSMGCLRLFTLWCPTRAYPHDDR
jgi:hypothetical protein